MASLSRFGFFSPVDYAALALLVLAWLGIGWRIENPSARRVSVAVLMEGYRRDWMTHMVSRNPRIFDAQLLANLRQGTAFFASASMIAIGGGLALIGNTEPLEGLVEDFALTDTPSLVWEVKLLVILLFLSNAFLKFVWSHRLCGYCSVLMAAVPNSPEEPLAYIRAGQAAEINISAARSFNRAMRATYFALAATAWILGPVALILATAVTIAMLWRREFASQSRAALLRSPPETAHPTQT